MKKLVIFLLFLTFTLDCFSITPHSDNQDWIYGQIYSENRNMICDFTYYFFNKEIEIELGSSGYLIKPTYVYETENTIEFGFLKVWIGAEEINNNDSRELTYYTGNWIDLETGKSDGCFITTIANQEKILKRLETWKFTNGVQIQGKSINMNFDYYKSHYPNTRGVK